MSYTDVKSALIARFIGVEGGRVIYEVGSGQYQFRGANQSTQGKQ